MSFTYEQQNKAIFRDSIIFSIVCFTIEIIFFLFYFFADLITYDIRLYILKNLISPSLINFTSILIGYLVYRKI